MIRLETLSNPHPNECSEGCFVAFVGKHPVWENYDGLAKAVADTEIPLVFMVNRWDGMIGLPGGKVDPGETLRQTAVREVYEEVGYNITEDRLVPWNSFMFYGSSGKPFISHMFVVECKYEELKDIGRNIRGLGHFGSEISGTFLAQLYPYGKYKGIRNLLNGSLAPSVKEELLDLLDRYFKTPFKMDSSNKIVSFGN